MKIYISVDIEGICAVNERAALMPGGHGYDRACRLMKAEALAAVAGAQAAHTDAGTADDLVVTVRDAHGTAANLDPEGWPEPVRLITGWSDYTGYAMVEGLDLSYTAVVLVGYHGGAGAPHGVLAHTMSGRTIREVRINGKRANEAVLVALLAGTYGVPVVALAGDSAAVEETAAWIPGIATVSTKDSLSVESAVNRRPEDVRAEITDTVRAAIHKPIAKPLKPEGPLKVEVVFHNRSGAQLAALDSGTELDPVAGSIKATVEDGRELARRFEVWMRLAQSAR